MPAKDRAVGKLGRIAEIRAFGRLHTVRHGKAALLGAAGAVLHTHARRVADDAFVQAIARFAFDLAAEVDAVGLSLFQRRGGEGDVHVVVREVVGEDGHVVFIGDDDELVGGFAELEHHEQLCGIGFDRVVHVARADNHAAVDGGTHIRVDAAVHAVRMSEVDGGAAVEDDVAVGVDAVALAAGQRLDAGKDIAVVHGQHAKTVFGDVERIVARGDVKRTSVDGQVAVRDFDALVVCVDGQAAGPLKTKGDQRINRAVELRLAVRLRIGMGAGDEVGAAGRKLDGHAVFACRARILCGIHGDRRSSAAGEVGVVKDQADAVRTACFDGKLNVCRCAADAIAARCSEGNHPVVQRFEFARNILVCFVDVSQVNRQCRIGGNGVSVYGNGAVGQEYGGFAFGCCAGHEEAQGQHPCKQVFHALSIPSILFCQEYTGEGW